MNTIAVWGDDRGFVPASDGGWELSASADNSWASKIHLCQFVSETVLGVVPDAATAARADRAHADWQRHGAADHAVSDQFTAGIAKGSLYTRASSRRCCGCRLQQAVVNSRCREP